MTSASAGIGRLVSSRMNCSAGSTKNSAAFASDAPSSWTWRKIADDSTWPTTGKPSTYCAGCVLSGHRKRTVSMAIDA
eukprot:8699555-Lingulodinium_polyedra.AAC.1